jgi:hypothetical protein
MPPFIKIYPMIPAPARSAQFGTPEKISCVGSVSQLAVVVVVVVVVDVPAAAAACARNV